MVQLRRTGLDLEAGITVLVGENGSGKSTLVEAIAAAWAGRLTAAVTHWTPPVAAADADLHWQLRLTGQHPPPQGGCFLRAEAMHAHFTAVDAGTDLRAFDGRGLNTRSHGEGFLAFLESRQTERGLYVLRPASAARPAAHPARAPPGSRRTRSCSPRCRQRPLPRYRPQRHPRSDTRPATATPCPAASHSRQAARPPPRPAPQRRPARPQPLQTCALRASQPPIRDDKPRIGYHAREPGSERVPARDPAGSAQRRCARSISRTVSIVRVERRCAAQSAVLGTIR